MKGKQIIALILSLMMLVMICACGETPAETTGASVTEATPTTNAETTTEETTTEETTTVPFYATTTETTALVIPTEEIENAVIIRREKEVVTKNVPLLIILANYDADGDGENDWDENEPDKLYADMSAPYYGEQWASTEISDHYDKYFGEGNSLVHYFDEMTMGAIHFYPIEFDVKPEMAAENGIIEVVVKAKHPAGLSSERAVVEACDPYIDFSQYDVNHNGKIDMDEMGILVLNPGADAAASSGKKYANSASPRNYFEVWGNSSGLGCRLDGVSFSRVANVGEYKTVGTIMPIGTSCHELAHNLGASDLYDVDNYSTGDTVAGWPMPYSFSLQCSGNKCGNNNMPSYLDPFQRIRLGWAESVTVEDGVYTICSTCTGDYVALRVNTPDPDEYYLIEIRLQEGCEEKLTSGSMPGGIMVWHIDEGITRRYLSSGMACSPCTDGKSDRHDPGVVPLFRNSFDSAGRMMRVTAPLDPFYYYDPEEPLAAICDTGAFRSATAGVQSLNSYPTGWGGKENFNLRVEVLSEAGQEMTIKITTGEKDFTPVLTADYLEKTHHSITVSGAVTWSNCAINECGIVLSTSETLLENSRLVMTEIGEDGNFSYTFDDLQPNTRYYYKVFVFSENGYAEASSSTPTQEAPKPKETVKISFFRGLSSPDKAYTMTFKFGSPVEIKFPMNKAGYVFEGWYLDEALTMPFDVTKPLEAGLEDFSLYAKWVEE